MISDEEYIDTLTLEVTDTMIEQNFELIKLIKLEKFEECALKRDRVLKYLLDVARVVSKETGSKTQTINKHFKNINKHVYHELLNKFYFKSIVQ